MWRWIRRHHGHGEGHDHGGVTNASRYRMAVLEAERSSAAAGMCRPGHFDGSAKALSEPALRRALEFFMASSPREEFLEPWDANRSLLVYLRGVHPVPAVLTIGWYEFGGRHLKEHSFDEAQRAACGPAQSPRRGRVHVWVTTRAFEIIDVCMPTLLDTEIRRSDDRNMAFYFPSPAARDLVVYHPTAIVEEAALSEERGKPARSEARA